MLMVAEKVPATSETVPIISRITLFIFESSIKSFVLLKLNKLFRLKGIYLTIVMSFTSISVIMAVIVTNVQENTKNCTANRRTRLPKMIRLLFLNKLAKYLGMDKHGKEILKNLVKIEMREKKKKSDNQIK